MSSRRRAVLLVILVAGVVTAGVALAQTSASFDLHWNVLGGGGGGGASSTFELDTTIGQPIVGASQSASFRLQSGFWPRGAGAPTQTPIGTPTAILTATPTATPTATHTGAPTITPSATPTNTPTGTRTPTGTPTRTPTSLPPAMGPVGDADCSGAVDAVDATFILQFGAGLIGAVPCPREADADQNGMVNAIDATLILQLGAGLISMLPP